MKTLTKFSVTYPITVLMLVLGILVLGYISFKKLGVDLFPDLNNPRVFVEIKAGERPPEEIEKQFVENVESLAIRQKKVVQVSSISQVGSAQITVEYSWDADMDEAFLDLQKAMNTFLQNADLDELNITQHDPNAEPVMLLALSHPNISDMDDLRKVSENYLRNELVRLEGIADVEILGKEEKEVVIETDPYMLEAYNITPTVIAGRIQSYNSNVSGGSIVEMGTKYIIKGVGEFQSITEIGQVIIGYRTDPNAINQSNSERVPVYLKDIANIRFENKEADNIVRVNQKRCVALAIYKETKFNTVKATDDLLGSLADLRKALPGYDLDVIQNQGEFINSAIDEVKQTAMIGIGLAILVLFLFLRRFGATLIISIAIPISIVATFNLMYFNGLTLNIMTLGGLALGAGMLVDNAIVVMENIFRNIEGGMSVKDAAIEGTAQVGGAITASTITTIIVFLPIVYLHGAAGELFKDQAWTVAFALVSSLVVAILVIPMLSTKLIKPASIAKAQSIRFGWYKNFLAKTLKASWLVIGSAVLLVIVALFAIPIVGSEFMPKTDTGEFSIELQLPEGTELYRTEQTVAGIEEMVRSIFANDIQTIYSKIGPSSTLSGDEQSIFESENTAVINIALKKESKQTSQSVIRQLSLLIQDIPDVETQFVQAQTALQTTLGTASAPVVVEIKGKDLDIIQNLTEQVKVKLVDLETLTNIETSFDDGRPEIDVVLDRVRAGILGVGINDVSTELSNQLQGHEAGQWDNDGELQDITIKMPKVSVNQLDAIVLNVNNQKIRLDEIADIKTNIAPKEILRNNQVRIGEISAHLASKKPIDHVVSAIEENLHEIEFPAGYSYQISGEEQKRREAFDNLRFALLLSIVLVYMVMASQFESLVHPLTILLTIPLAGVGAVFIFLILGATLNIMALIGIIMLVGIAVNDSIILVDAINQLKRAGLSRIDAIIEAGQRRIRPIIMTSVTTILALLPLTFGFGEGAALRAPMALAVIGGLVTSTLLTLVVIPSVYLKFDQLGRGVATD
jgi:hydrophobic/amphiphilic exporter-1 (mainly G- bacteria), HAE1 family